MGFAMFSMFFGAGNIIFPLALGSYAKNDHIYAVIGLLLTAVFIPFLGLFTMIYYHGNYMHFFDRMGKKLGFCISLFILLIIGPFGALPRCITTSYSTLHITFESLSLPIFSALSLGLVYLFTFKSKNVIEVLGTFLTPILLILLSLIVFKGLFYSDPQEKTTLSSMTIFMQGLLTGYNTMDLIAAFFFSTVVILALNKEKDTSHEIHTKKDHKTLFLALFIGAFLLSITYLGFTSLSAGYAELLENTAKDELLGKISFHLLGPYASILVSLAVFFACLTTEIALSVVFAEFLHIYIVKAKLSYQVCLILTLIVAFIVSTFRFEGISNFLVPILQIIYPSLIVMTLCNLAHKLYGFNWIKTPVIATFSISLLIYFYA
jgi:LIVCS family branched-chain amino acid:cation transporter